MIPRYTLPEIESIFSTTSRLERWLAVELTVVSAWAGLDRVPRDAADRIIASAPVVDETFVEAVHARERETHHDVAAFVDVVSSRLGADGRWIHYGLTSSDVVDTAQAVALGEAGTLVVHEAVVLFDLLAAQAEAHRRTPGIGRTHGVHAEPVLFGERLALIAHQVSRAAEHVARSTANIKVGKVSGAVGNFGIVEPQVEESVCQALGLRPISASQALPRDLHADLVFSFARLATSVESLALQVRLGHQSEVVEWLEGFDDAQKGSSAMPHKANPVNSEKLCGLARLLRSYVAPALEDVALWHERDLSHSSVERVILADACALAHYVVRSAQQLVKGWVVDVDRMRTNLDASGDLVCSQAVVHNLIDEGRSRDDAYRLVQSAAFTARQSGTSLRRALDQAGVHFDADTAERLFDPDHSLQNAGRSIDALQVAWATNQQLNDSPKMSGP